MKNRNFILEGNYKMLDALYDERDALKWALKNVLECNQLLRDARLMHKHPREIESRTGGLAYQEMLAREILAKLG
jgi:hypothetical protein